MKNLFISLCLMALCLAAPAQPTTVPQLQSEVFELIDLDAPAMAEVKSFYEKGNTRKAAEALLKYYKARTGIVTPDIRDVSKVKITAQHQKWADDALEHKFFVMDSYKEPFHYGDDINWRYWPVQDNELRWQLHRQKWFIPMGKAYRISCDEKYAVEWTKQYVDWIRKNPLVKIEKGEYEITENSTLKEDAENARWAWRPLEACTRLQDQTQQFQLFNLTFVHSGIPHRVPCKLPQTRRACDEQLLEPWKSPAVPGSENALRRHILPGIQTCKGLEREWRSDYEHRNRQAGLS